MPISYFIEWGLEILTLVIVVTTLFIVYKSYRLAQEQDEPTIIIELDVSQITSYIDGDYSYYGLSLILRNTGMGYAKDLKIKLKPAPEPELSTIIQELSASDFIQNGISKFRSREEIRSNRAVINNKNKEVKSSRFNKPLSVDIEYKNPRGKLSKISKDLLIYQYC